MSPATVTTTGQAEANVAIVRRLMQEGFSEGNLDGDEHWPLPGIRARQPASGHHRA